MIYTNNFEYEKDRINLIDHFQRILKIVENSTAFSAVSKGNTIIELLKQSQWRENKTVIQEKIETSSDLEIAVEKKITDIHLFAQNNNLAAINSIAILNNNDNDVTIRGDIIGNSYEILIMIYAMLKKMGKEKFTISEMTKYLLELDKETTFRCI